VLHVIPFLLLAKMALSFHCPEELIFKGLPRASLFPSQIALMFSCFHSVSLFVPCLTYELSVFPHYQHPSQGKFVEVKSLQCSLKMILFPSSLQYFSFLPLFPTGDICPLFPKTHGRPSSLDGLLRYRNNVNCIPKVPLASLFSISGAEGAYFFGLTRR